MFMIQLTLCASLLFVISSAIPVPGPYLYSAVIHNKQSIPVRCTVTWEFNNSPMAERDVFTVPGNDAKTVNERNIDMDGWTAAAFIQEIQCGGSSLSQPFPGVDSFERLWNFNIESNELLSVGPTEPEIIDE